MNFIQKELKKISTKKHKDRKKNRKITEQILNICKLIPRN